VKEVKPMDLIKWEPFRELSSIRRQMDRLWDSFFEREEAPAGLWAPEIDISETPEEILVKADVPGIDQKDLSVTLSGDNLTIKGERKEEKEENGKHFHRVERRYGGFHRSVPLPVSVDATKISAEYNNGVLEIHLPKTAESKPKEIKINVKK
jgi:HSP20 family protein